MNALIFLMMQQQSLHCCHAYLNAYHHQLAELFHQLILFSYQPSLAISFKALACVVAPHNRHFKPQGKLATVVINQ